jgi:hypothetical protein
MAIDVGNVDAEQDRNEWIEMNVFMVGWLPKK